MTATAETAAGAFAARPGGSRQLAGTGTLLRFALRRDRVLIPVWVAVNALMVLSMPGTIKGLYGTAAERADLMRQMRPTPRCAPWSARSSTTASARSPPGGSACTPVRSPP